MKKKIIFPVMISALLLGACGGSKISTTPSESLSSSINSVSSEQPLSSAANTSSDRYAESKSENSSKPGSTSESKPSSSSTGASSSNQTNSSSGSKSSASSSASSASSSASSVNSSVEQKIKITLNNLSGDVATIEDLTQEGLAGSEAKFKVTAKAGYIITGVTAMTSKNRTAKLTELGDNVYQYGIPTDGILNITVSVEEEVKYQDLYVVDTANLLKKTPEILVDTTYVSLSNPQTNDQGNIYYTIPEKSTIRFSLPRPNTFKDLGITFNSQQYKPDEYGYVIIDFTANPGQNLIVNTYGTRDAQALNAVNSEHLTIKFFSDKTLKNEIFNIGIDEDFYIKVESEDKSIYTLKSMTYAFQNKGSTIRTEHDITPDFVEEEEYYWRKHTSPSTALEDGITYTVTEDNMNKYLGQPFVGNFLAIQLFTYIDKNFTSWERGLSIVGSGRVTYGAKQMLIVNTYDDDNGVTHLSDKESGYGNEIYYKNGVILTSNNNSTTLASLFSASANSYGDDIIAFQLEDGTEAEEYTVDAASFIADNSLYTVAVAYHNNEFYKAAVVKKGTNYAPSARAYWMDVQVEMIYGDKVTDNEAIYKIKSGDSEVAFVGFKGNGGNRNRVLLTSEISGVYTNEENEQLVICEGNAIYNGELYTCSVNENTVTLTSTEHDYTITINVAERTFEVTNHVSRTIVLGPFAGKKFRKRFNAAGLNNEYGYYMEFSATEAKFSCIADIYWEFTTNNHSTYYWGRNIDATYVYDPESGDFTTQIFGYNNELVNVTFHYDGSTITFMSDELSGGKGVFRNVLCTLTEC